MFIASDVLVLAESVGACVRCAAVVVGALYLRVAAQSGSFARADGATAVAMWTHCRANWCVADTAKCAATS